MLRQQTTDTVSIEEAAPLQHHRAQAELAFSLHYNPKRFSPLFYNMRSKLPDKNVNKKKEHAFLMFLEQTDLPCQLHLIFLIIWLMSCAHSWYGTFMWVSIWTDTCTSRCSAHFLTMAVLIYVISWTYQQVSLEPHPSSLLPWHADYHTSHLSLTLGK